MDVGDIIHKARIECVDVANGAALSSSLCDLRQTWSDKLDERSEQINELDADEAFHGEVTLPRLIPQQGGPHMDSVPSIRPMTRRDFLRASSVTLLAAPLIQLPSSFWESSHRFFTGSEAATVNAMCERIIPADADPGAAWAGVVEFIDRKLAGYHRRYQSLYRTGLKGLGESSRALYHGEFIDLDNAQQDDLLRKLESGQAPGDVWSRVSAGDFFNRVVEHTMEGFYGGPRHGGNRDAVSWRMLGLPTPPVRSRRPLSADWNSTANRTPQGT